MGIPVIATILPGVREAVGRGEAIIVDDLCSPVLAAELLRLMGAPAERARIGTAGMELVNARFGWRHLSGLFEAEMDRTASAAHPSPAFAAYSAGVTAPMPSANNASPP